WDTLADDVQEYLLSRAYSEEERAAVPQRLALHPGTGRVVATGLWRPDEDRGGVLVAADSSGDAGPEWQPFEDGAFIYRGSATDILQDFWRYVGGAAGTLVASNGRGFDGPFVLLRSAILGVAPSRNPVPYRYSFKEHCDLLEVLPFHGARK